MKDNVVIKRLRAPVRIDFGGGTTDIYPFTHLYGGAVLNAAIDKYVVGALFKSSNEVGLRYHAAIPTSSGLGTSSAMSLLWLALISQKEMFTKEDRAGLAETVYNIEKTFKGVNGKQDQYAAAFGGINFMEFHNDKVKVNRLRLKKSFVQELENHLVLVYTGQPHFSASSNNNAIKNLKSGKNNQNLLRIKHIASQMRDALVSQDLEKFSILLNKETEERRQLSKATVPRRLRKIIQSGLRHGATGAKVCGSGGGGSILFFGNKPEIKEKFSKRIINFKFDFDGLKRIDL